MKEIVETRVREELERRKDEIENEVKRRVDVLKRTMEKQMMLEVEKRNTEEMRRLIVKEVESGNACPSAVRHRSSFRKTNENGVKISREFLLTISASLPKRKNDW